MHAHKLQCIFINNTEAREGICIKFIRMIVSKKEIGMKSGN